MAREPQRWTENGIRVAAYYQLRDTRASMWFEFLVGGIPSGDDCQRIASLVTEWDQDGASPGSAYRLFRSSRSRLAGVTAWSIDPRANTLGYVIVPRDDGYGAELVSDALSDNVAPIMYWQCAPSQPRRRGRTYMVGLCHNVLQTARPDYINADAAGPLVLSFNGLITLGLARADAPMVVLTGQHRNVYVRPCPVSIVANATIGPGRVGTQRRRLPRMPSW